MNSLVNSQGFTYSEDGFVLENLSTLPFASFGTLAPQFPGSTALYNNNVNGLTRLTQGNGNPFDLNSIDLAPFTFGSPITSVTFTGFLDSGGSVTQTFTTSGIGFVLETFNFSGFEDVIAVEWMQNPPFHQFDNIVVMSGIIPEPSSILLGLTGLVAVGGFARRRRHAK